ncbi:MATH domain and coiled-coil domain-containing protein At2g42480-like [Aegilops tauschii subsp. strangulata]|uniref:MATH domain and coiled-coil domain-containing protein At2g42480-like n=1 Tax=Aegilops tauschii subsp. strangulata TaxID=200361 RepID=UPI00098B9BFA|nr:MATH domain and coiled-coil domain-containing protein At2g42480-like [Aegilops tauschii subsp. strangulata]
MHDQQHHIQEKVMVYLESEELRCVSAAAEQSSGFLVNDSCVFGVQFIKVVAVKGNDVLETLFLQKTSNISSDPQAYTWNIDDFFVLKNPSTSPEFQLCGHKWFITIYPSGSDSNGNYISPYLSMKDTLHKDSGILAEVSISIKDQETGKHMKTSARIQFKNCTRTWTWEKLISLEDFKDSSKGYLVKKKCCIEVQVAVIGSSKWSS